MGVVDRPRWAATAVFICGLTGGSFGTITSKILYGLDGVDTYGETHKFAKPVMRTFMMFVAMIMALPVHYAYTRYKRSKLTGDALQADKDADKISSKMLAMLALPSLCDTCGSVLSSIGLLYIPSSMFQMMKAFVVVFVAFHKVCFLGHHVKGHMWAGIFVNVVAITLVGYVGVLQQSANVADSSSNALVGCAFVLASCFVQSMQYVIEERFMSSDENCPPLVVVGMEGFWGLLICLFGLYPLCYYLPGNDHGSYERLDTGLSMMMNSSSIQLMVLAYCCCILILNTCAIFVTYLLSSVWKAIMDNFRPLAVWMLDLVIFYVVTNGAQGEAWNQYSHVQLLALFLLLTGTAIYDGGLRLPGFAYEALPTSEKEAEAMNSPLAVSSPLSPLVARGVARERALSIEEAALEAGAKKAPYGTFL